MGALDIDDFPLYLVVQVSLNCPFEFVMLTCLSQISASSALPVILPLISYLMLIVSSHGTECILFDAKVLMPQLILNIADHGTSYPGNVADCQDSPSLHSIVQSPK